MILKMIVSLKLQKLIKFYQTNTKEICIIKNFILNSMKKLKNNLDLKLLKMKLDNLLVILKIMNLNQKEKNFSNKKEENSMLTNLEDIKEVFLLKMEEIEEDLLHLVNIKDMVKLQVALVIIIIHIYIILWKNNLKLNKKLVIIQLINLLGIKLLNLKLMIKKINDSQQKQIMIFINFQKDKDFLTELKIYYYLQPFVHLFTVI